MSDIRFRQILRSALASGDPAEMAQAILEGRRLGLTTWQLIVAGIPPKLFTEELAIADVYMRESEITDSLLLDLGLEPDNYPSIYPPGTIFVPGRENYRIAGHVRYPVPDPPNWTLEQYWDKSKNYYYLPDGTVILNESFQTPVIIRDEKIRRDLEYFSWQADIVRQARQWRIEEALEQFASACSPADLEILRDEILPWHVSFRQGYLDEPDIINGIPFWQIGRNASCQFSIGVLNGQRWRYAYCDGDAEPSVRPTADFSGYHGHS